MSLLIALAAGILGVTFGSFIALATYRAPRSLPLSGRSRCDHCRNQLRWFELIPIVSFLALRGHCRSCDGTIGPRQIVIELIALSIGVAAALLVPTPQSLWIATLGWLLLTLAIFDLEHFWLPNQLVLVVLLAGIGIAALLEPWALPERIIGCAAGFVALETLRQLYRKLRNREGMGAGDPKLLAALGAWVGWQPLPFILFGASTIGLIWVATGRIRGRAIDRAAPVPFGTMLAVAGFLFTLAVPFMSS